MAELSFYPYERGSGSNISPSPFSNITDADSTNSASVSFNSGTKTLYLTFNTNNKDGDFIPSGATINSVSCAVKSYLNVGAYGSDVTTSTIQMSTGTTVKGSSINIPTSSYNPKRSFTNTGTWTVNELWNAAIKFSIVFSPATSYVNISLVIYGATLTVTYTYNGITYTVASSSSVSGVTVSPASQTVYPTSNRDITITASSLDGVAVTDNGTDVTDSLVAGTGTYTYSLTNISANHTILVAEASTDKFYFKNGSTWVTAKKVYKKISGAWVEQSDLPSVITGDVHYKRGTIWQEQSGSTLRIYGAQSATQSEDTLTLT